MTKTCPHCHATVLSASQPERATPERVALEEAVRLFEGYGLIAGRTEADPLAAGRWINNARAALAATPAVGGEVAHAINEWADLGSNSLQWLKNIKDGISTADEALAEMSSNYERVLAIGRAALAAPPASPLRGRELSEDLALADYRDKAYERLHALCGTRNDAPNWADIACILRERDELYEKLRASPPEQPAAECDCLMCMAEGENSPHRIRSTGPDKESDDVR